MDDNQKMEEFVRDGRNKFLKNSIGSYTTAALGGVVLALGQTLNGNIFDVIIGGLLVYSSGALAYRAYIYRIFR